MSRSEITPNIGLILDPNLTATAKQNLRKIDTAFGTAELIVDINTELNGQNDIKLQPGRDSEATSKNIYLGTSTYPADTVYVYAATLDFSNVGNITGWTVTGIVNGQIASDAEIEQSKISGLVSDLSNKAEMSDITGAINDHELTYVHTDIAHVNRTALDAVAGVNTGDEDTTSIKTKLGAADVDSDGYLTSVDWGTFNGKQDALGFTPVNVAGDTMLGALGIHKQGIVFDITNDFVGTPAEGTVWWNKDDHTLNIQSDIAGTINQVGQENWLRARNNTGSTIAEGAVVYISGANTARPTIALAVASVASTADKVIGIVTADIPDGQLGIVTTFGLVRHLATDVDGDGASLADGDPIFLSATTAGEWVKTKPHAPNHCVCLGQIVNAAAGAVGNLFVNVSTGAHLQDLHDVNVETSLANRDLLEYDSVLGYWKNRADITQYTMEKTGFADPHGLTVTYDSTARTITVTHATGIIYLVKNKRINLGTTWTSTPHSATLDAKYFLYISDLGVDTWYTSFQGFELNAVYISQVNYFTAYKFAIREVHGLMDWQTWSWLHRNMGTFKQSGGAVTGIVIDSSASLNDLRPAVSEALVVDEDLPTTLLALSDNSSYMRVHFDTGAAVFTSDVNIFPQDGTNMQYNLNPITGTALAAMTTNNRWVNVYCCAVPVTADAGSQAFRFLWFLGQVQYTTLAAAQAETFTSLYTGDLTATILPEIVPIAQVTFKRTTGAATSYNVQVDVAPAAITGTRSSLISVSGAVPTSHAGLLDRGLADQHPATAISADVTNFVAAGGVSSVLSGADTNSQLAFDTLARGAAPRYTLTFVVLDWGGVSGAYTLSIPGATHLRGTSPNVIVQELTGGTKYRKVTVEEDTDESNGDITLTSTETFIGRVIVI